MTDTTGVMEAGTCYNLDAQRCFHHRAPEEPSVCSTVEGFSYGGKTPPQQHCASAPAQYKMWEPVVAQQNGRKNQVGPVSLVAEQMIVSARFLGELLLVA